MNNFFSFQKWLLSAATLALLLGIGLSAAQAQMAYIPNADDNNVSVIDIPTATVVTTVPTGPDLRPVAISPDGQTVYFASFSGNELIIFDAGTNTVTDTLLLSSSGSIGSTLNADGSKLYISSTAGNVMVINTITKVEEATISIGGTPGGLEVSPDGTELYVSRFNGANVQVVEIATNTVVATIATGGGSRWVTYSPDGSQTYVSNANADNVSVINTTTRQVVATIPVGDFPGVSVFSADGNTLYVANQFSDNISVVDVATNTVTSTLAVGNGPSGLDITPGGDQLMVANEAGNNVMLIDATSLMISDTIAVGSSPYAFGNFISPSLPLMPSPPLENTVYVLYNDTLGTLNPATGALTNIGRIRDVTTDMTVTRMANLAVNQAGEMFVSGHGLGQSPADFYRIDPATAQVELVGSFSGANLKGMAFDLNDSLLAVEWAGAGQDVYRFNPTDGSSSLLFDDVLPPSWYGGMEYRFSDGLMYLSNWSNGQVHSVDPVSGAYNLVFSGNAVPGHESGDLFFDGDDNLYIATGIGGSGPSLWQVNLADGTSSKVADLAYGVKAAVLSPPAAMPASALNFDGVDDRIQMDGLDLTGPTTIEVWVKPSPKFDFSTIISNKFGGFEEPGFIFSINAFQDSSRSLVFETDSATVISDPGVIEWNQWQHVAVSTDGVSEARLYVNGFEVPVDSSSGVNLDLSNFTTYIGDLSVYFMNAHFEGDMDELRIWNVARTGAEILAYKDCKIDPTTTGLLAYYDFDEGNIGVINAGVDTLNDETGNGNLGTLEDFALAGVTSNWVEGNAIGDCPDFMAATSLAFDGIDDHVVLPNDMASAFTGGSMSGTAWCYLDANSTWATIIKNWGDANQGAFHFGLESSSQNLGIQIQQANGTDIVVASPDILPTGQWVFVAFTADGDSIRLYQDGELKATADYDGTLFTEFPATFLGAKPNDAGTGVDPLSPGYWNGRLDEISLWDRALTADELMQVSGCQPDSATPNLVAYYSFNQGLIDANNGTDTTLIDNGSDAFNGALTNFALTGTESNWTEGNTLEECAPTVNIEETLSTSSISLVPNPATDLLNVRMEVKQAAEARVAIFDLSGRMIQARNEFLYQGSQLLEMDVRQLSGGLYFLVIEIGNERHSEKFVKRN